MKKIIIIISALCLGILAVTWLYFKKINSSNISNEQIFNVIPNDASIIFEYKNEAYFYDIFKDFMLFDDILGKNNLTHLKVLKQIFVDDAAISEAFTQSDLFFSIHPTGQYLADLLIVAPIANQNASEAEILQILKTKYKISQNPEKENTIYQLAFSNKSAFSFFVYKNLVVGSFEEKLVKKSIAQIEKGTENTSFNVDFSAQRNKNSIANLYLNFSKIRDFANHFSARKNPYETYFLKSFDASASLNINYQKNAFMFSGITNPNLKAKNYFNLFLDQQPGVITLAKRLPLDVANYALYYVSDYKKFKDGLKELLIYQKEFEGLNTQISNISIKHAINLDKEIIPVFGKEFGVFQLASGDNIGIIKTTNTNRLSFLLSTISSEVSADIRHFDDSFILYNYFGDPFKQFKRPYYTTIENHLIVANSTVALTRFVANYKAQRLIGLTDKNIDFQQYLSNQGNIFYFIHNGNSKAIFRSFLSKPAYKDFRSDNFNWKDLYGFAIQFSADKDKFYTNLYMNHTPEREELLPQIDSTALKF
ncbi:hypothetical protein [Pedobacter arcticus]|uniref:hypothetical protein n=1 Tax=Pedobacter arcticus TaxID=752140 RepID=UPI0002F0435E|nr:hypothetical protein [Pedobacter arcticus]